MIADILRFNKEAPALLVKARAEKLTLGQLLQQGKYSKAFSDWYLLWVQRFGQCRLREWKTFQPSHFYSFV